LNLAADAVADDFLGFHLGQSVEVREMGLLYYVMTSSQSLGEALHRCARYSSIVNESVALKYDTRTRVRIAFNCVGVSRHLDRHQMEFFAVILIRTVRQLTNRRLVPTRVRFTHRSDKTNPELLEFFGRDIEFGASTDELNFASSIERIPIVSADPYLNKLLLKYCEEALARRPALFNTLRPKVENAIVMLLPHGEARVAEVAEQLGMATRTLARRLSSEGATFSEILEKLKYDLAQRFLADKSLSISHIAWLLGYQEASAFTHAYKRWTGQAPREARALRDATNE
jgi:AraC-like DNA-binding protein